MAKTTDIELQVTTVNAYEFWNLSSPGTPINGATTPTETQSGDGHLSDSTLHPHQADAADVEASIHQTQQDSAPYHIFSKRQNGMCTISSALGVSASQIALTITVYMIVQAIAPSLFGVVSDTAGRRLTFVTTLAIYTGANLGLAFTSSFPMLLVLRGIQAAGSSATISISVGVISDIACPSERGSFMGTNAGMRMISQAIGPVIGGLLNNAWGFRSIFWFLFSFSLLVLSLLLIFLPEAQREMAGNGSIRLGGFHKPFLYSIRKPEVWGFEPSPPNLPSSRPPGLRRMFAPLMHVFKRDILILLSWGAVIYTLWSMVTSSTTTVLLRSFPDLTQWQVGLCFLPNGMGCVLGSVSTGWLMDKSFKSVEEQYNREHDLNSTNAKKNKDFPFERARPLMPYFSFVFIVAMALYGPSYEFNDLRRQFAANLVSSLGLQFIIAFTATAIFNINSTILIDNFPDGPASATATNNLYRCLLGAAGVSVIQPLIDAVKIRNAFLILTGVAVFVSPLVWIQWKLGEKWRLERQRKVSESGQ